MIFGSNAYIQPSAIAAELCAAEDKIVAMGAHKTIWGVAMGRILGWCRSACQTASKLNNIIFWSIHFKYPYSDPPARRTTPLPGDCGLLSHK